MNDMDVSACLRGALRLASSCRWVAEWLFGSSSAPFHSSPTLPPHFLKLSLGVQASHTVLLPTTPEYPLPVCTRFCDVLFVPVAEAEGVVTGYSLERGDHVEDNRLPAPGPFNPPSVSRFAFDTSRQDLLVVTAPGPGPITGIIATNPGPHGTRRQFIFTVPAYEYSFDHLPATVLSMYSNNEHRLEPLAFEKNVQSGHASQSRRALTSERLPLDHDNSSSQNDAITPDCKSATEQNLGADLRHNLDDQPREPGSGLSALFHNKDQLHNPCVPASTERNGCPPEFLTDPLISLPIIEMSHGPQREPTFSDIWNESTEVFPELRNAPFNCTSPSTDEVTSHVPWFLSSTGTTADGLSPSLCAKATDTSSGAFSTARLSFAVSTLRRSLSGRYYGPCVRVDMLHVLTGKYTTFFTGKINYSVTKLEGTSMTTLERNFADKYYLAALSVSPDQFLIHGSQAAATIRMANDHFEVNSTRRLQTELRKDDVNLLDKAIRQDIMRDTRMSEKDLGQVQKSEGAGEGKATTVIRRLGRSATRPLAPAPVKEVQSHVLHSDEEHKGKCIESKEERQRRLAVARKQRNRLSAARSNMRKRRRTQTALDEIEQNRRIAEELTKQKHDMIRENERLRELIRESAA